MARVFWSGIGLVGAGIAAPVLTYLIRPLFGAPDAGSGVRMGKVEDLPLNVPQRFILFPPQRLEVARRVVEGWVTDDSQMVAWVVRMADKIYVFDPHCTHLGCAYRWEEQAKEFFCPCHAGVFSLTGKVISGPPPRPLDLYSYEVREGFLYVVPTPTKQMV
ncbi:MAG TPA: ubiquinol-cytochrome c reductase iron-sulfur subunit [Candidatus Binataceae bacterium]|nr:ubiquinol-cytochrome c reductase iron-sulfur subunit [Candidatus Binataceae bacterium]